MDNDSRSNYTSSGYSYPSSDGSEPATPGVLLEYITLYLTNEDPTNTFFVSSTGQQLYHASSTGPTEDAILAGSSTTPHITRVSRLYGSAARAAKEAAFLSGDESCEGLLLAEMEWLRKTRSSRIRFGGGKTSNQYVIDVRVDEFLKSTKGRGLSKMFAARDGRIYKWKADVEAPVELVECEDGRRVSGRLVTFHEGENGSMDCLRISTDVLSILDQVILSWVIMERERRLHLDSDSGCSH